MTIHLQIYIKTSPTSDPISIFDEDNYKYYASLSGDNK